MALNINFKKEDKELSFAVGDRVKVVQSIKEGGKERQQIFEGIVIGIKGREEKRTFTVRRIGAQQVGIERIFSLSSPALKDVKVVRKGGRGVRRAKLYYTRDKSKKEIEKIYARSSMKEITKSKKGEKGTKKRKIKTKKKTSKRSRKNK
jgi:large subunit ribosomal protein L19